MNAKKLKLLQHPSTIYRQPEYMSQPTKPSGIASNPLNVTTSPRRRAPIRGGVTASSEPIAPLYITGSQKMKPSKKRKSSEEREVGDLLVPHQLPQEKTTTTTTRPPEERQPRKLWTKAEDILLKSGIDLYGENNWRVSSSYQANQNHNPLFSLFQQY